MTLRFRPMTMDDLPLVHEWLLRPHVRRWWDDGSHPAYPEDDIDERRKAITGEDPTRHFVIELDGRPIGDIQDYRTDDDPEYLAQIGVDEPAIGIDLFIAEPDLVGRGLGPQVLRTFLRDVSLPHYGLDLVLIGPTRSNTAAIRAYEKAGFRFLKMYDEPGSAEKEHYLMGQRRADLEQVERWSAEELELITRGRRTGRPHRVRAWFAHENGVLWLRADEAEPDWLRNLKAHPECTVRVADREMGARYEPVVDHDAALRHLVALWRAKYGAEWVQDWFVERGREPVALHLAAKRR